MYACLGVNCPLHFGQDDPGLLRATAVTRGVEQTLNKSQHTKLTVEKKILPPLLPGFELATFRSPVQCSTNKLFRFALCVILLRYITLPSNVTTVKYWLIKKMTPSFPQCWLVQGNCRYTHTHTRAHTRMRARAHTHIPVVPQPLHQSSSVCN